MLKGFIVLSSFISIVTHFNIALAKEIPVQARLFLGTTGVNPKNANETLEAQGLKKIEGISKLGVEITYPIHRFVDIGGRYTKHLGDSQELTDDPNTDYNARIDQDTVMLLARFPFIKSETFRFDVFAGVGGSNTTMTLKTAGQDGEYTKRSSSEGWFGAPYAALGVSAAIGYKWIYLVFEGGFDNNKVDSFSKSGSVNGSIDTLDMSGSYFTLGIMFDGVPGKVN